MGIGSRRASTGAATAVLLLCFATAGTAAADEAPTDDTAVSADQTIEVNDEQGWEDGPEEPLDDSGQRQCDGPQTWYEYKSKKATFVPSWWNGTKFKDGPGGTMSVSVTKSGTISAKFTGTGEWSAGTLLAKAKATISIEVAASVTITTGHTYTRSISRNKYGHVQYGTSGYKASWTRYRRHGDGCGAGTVIASGTATLPINETGWKYWETSS
ncbi:hypothetical protein [Streptomyces sp. NPDC056464]|uniref:hypothetical protein n=1 Tax=Streptomyces sp. NPDC056464 TaxID=3345828 RepID=UPI0036761F1B